MRVKPPSEQKPRRPNRLLKIAILIVALAAFRGEVLNLLGWGYWLLRSLAGLPGAAPLARPAFALAAVLVTAVCFFFLAVLLTAHGVLPTRTFKEQIDVFYHLLRHFFRLHGPAINVKEGKIIGSEEEMKTARPGLAFVDQASALVLEKQMSQSPVRVVGPGIVFTRPGERVRGAAHLRKQIRRADDIHAYTSDGIEVYANVYVIFTLGQAPKVIKVVMDGAEKPENLRVAEVDPGTKTITAIRDHLDLQDKGEIYRTAVSARPSGFPSASLLPEEDEREYPPFEVNPERIFAAIYSQARNIQLSSVDDWTDLPARVAVKVFRNMLSRHTYDALYEPDGPNKDLRLLSVFKPAFDARLQGLGVLSYQYLRRRDGAPAQVGDVVDKKNYQVSPVQELRQPKELRSRGIKVIHAGFRELKPVNPAVMEQRLQAWRARWQAEVDLSKADIDPEMARIRNQSRLHTQREMSFTLSQIYRTTGNSQEALAERLVLALEEAAADPATRQLLPQATLDSLRGLRAWLLPEEQGQPGSPDDGTRDGGSDGARGNGARGNGEFGDGSQGGGL